MWLDSLKIDNQTYVQSTTNQSNETWFDWLQTQNCQLIISSTYQVEQLTTQVINKYINDQATTIINQPKVYIVIVDRQHNYTAYCLDIEGYVPMAVSDINGYGLRVLIRGIEAYCNPETSIEEKVSVIHSLEQLTETFDLQSNSNIKITSNLVLAKCTLDQINHQLGLTDALAASCEEIVECNSNQLLATLFPHVLQFEKSITAKQIGEIGKLFGLAVALDDHLASADLTISYVTELLSKLKLSNNLEGLKVSSSDFNQIAEAVSIQIDQYYTPRKPAFIDLINILKSTY